MSQDFGNFLRELRGKSSLRDVSKKIGLSHTYIRDLELGKKVDPSRKSLRKIADAYNYSYYKLLKKAGYLIEPETNEEMHKLLETFSNEEYDEEYLLSDLDNVLSLPSLTYKNHEVTPEDRELIEIYLKTLFSNRLKED